MSPVASPSWPLQTSIGFVATALRTARPGAVIVSEVQACPAFSDPSLTRQLDLEFDVTATYGISRTVKLAYRIRVRFFRKNSGKNNASVPPEAEDG